VFLSVGTVVGYQNTFTADVRSSKWWQCCLLFIEHSRAKCSPSGYIVTGSDNSLLCVRGRRGFAGSMLTWPGLWLGKQQERVRDSGVRCQIRRNLLGFQINIIKILNKKKKRNQLELPNTTTCCTSTITGPCYDQM
jgi:hypothetical protein